MTEEYNRVKEKGTLSDLSTGSSVIMGNLPKDVCPVPMDTEMKDKYGKYFSECCMKFLEYEKKNEQVFCDFRKKFCIEPSQNDTELNYKIGIRNWEIANESKGGSPRGRKNSCQKRSKKKE